MRLGKEIGTKVVGYDLIRSVAILVVFLGHIIEKQQTSETILLAFRSLTPGLSMSLLGFISAALLSAKKYDISVFQVKRFVRIYISLFLCLSVVLGLHLLIGKLEITQHIIMHFLGLSGFFELFLVKNRATVGQGLWFITVILLMYLVFPLLCTLFKHRYGRLHLALFVVLSTAAYFNGIGPSSAWNVMISFCVGVYISSNNYVDRLLNMKKTISISGSIGLLSLAALSTGGLLPYSIRGLLFAFYPLAFVPLFFIVSEKLPRSILALSGFFAGLSYEFYILHFYFINEGFEDFFPKSISLGEEIAISFLVTLVTSYVVSNTAAWIRRLAEKYLLAA